VRYRIIALSMCMSLILYLDRFALAPITNTLLEDLHLTKEEFGRRNMFFFWSYAIFQVPAGALADRFGARRMLTLYVIAWSLATIALGFVPGLLGLLGLHAVMGTAQAGAYPAAGSFLKRWANPTARAKANSFVAAGGRIGAVVAFGLTAWLALLMKSWFGLSHGWRGALVAYGVLGLLWSAFFWWYFRDQPSEHRGCNQAELDTIGNEPPPPVVEPLPITAILLSRNVWLLSISGFFINVGWIFLSTWQPSYLLETYSSQLQALFPELTTKEGLQGFKQIAAGLFASLAFLAGMAGGITGGFAADKLLQRFGPIWGRRIPGMCAGLFAGCLYLTCRHIGDIRLFVPLMLLISFTIDFGLGSLWATYQDIGGRHVGSVLGFANMWGNFGAGLYGWYYGALADHKEWPWVFFLSAMALFGVTMTWLVVDPTRQLVPSVAEKGA
jgi:sugar phosphate permease